MKFYAPTSKPVHISLTSGHAALVTQEGVELDTIFYKDAFAKGCLTTSPIQEKPVAAQPVIEPAQDFADAERITVIKAAIEAMLDEAVDGDFTSQGKPNLFKLSERAGFKVGKEEMEAVFAEL